MQDIPDAGLLEQFARSGSEAAFAELVRRHIPLVYSAAFRHTGNPQNAQEIAQAVFIILARKAASLEIRHRDEFGQLTRPDASRTSHKTLAERLEWVGGFERP